MSHELPEFSDELAHCDPCGYPDALTTYIPASLMPGDLDRIRNPFGGLWPAFAFLKRTCLRCGFQWAEAPLSPQKPDQPKLRVVPTPSGGWCGPSDNVYDIPPDLSGPPKPEWCDVLSDSGDRCKGFASHFDQYGSPHVF